VKHRKKDGSLLEVAAVSNPIEFHGRRARLVLANDVSETKRLEALLWQAQKMEAVGRLAGGVAHDFNNLLGVITGYSELLLKDLGPQHPGWKRVEQIQKAAERAAGLTRQLLAFSRKQVLQPRILDLNESSRTWRRCSGA
jgi:signal transduction histidine kinase